MCPRENIMTVAQLIRVLQGCKPGAEVMYPNMEIDQLEPIIEVMEKDRGKEWPERVRYRVVLR